MAGFNCLNCGAHLYRREHAYVCEHCGTHYPRKTKKQNENTSNQTYIFTLIILVLIFGCASPFLLHTDELTPWYCLLVSGVIWSTWKIATGKREAPKEK
jgi:DNA-directed RNA polymerase subunit RPC12/RpoP